MPTASSPPAQGDKLGALADGGLSTSPVHAGGDAEGFGGGDPSSGFEVSCRQISSESSTSFLRIMVLSSDETSHTVRKAMIRFIDSGATQTEIRETPEFDVIRTESSPGVRVYRAPGFELTIDLGRQIVPETETFRSTLKARINGVERTIEYHCEAR